METDAPADVRAPQDKERLGNAYSTAMNIWIGRFRESQAVVRSLEDDRTKILQLAEGFGRYADTDPALRLEAIVALIREEDEPEDHSGHDHD